MQRQSPVCFQQERYWRRKLSYRRMPSYHLSSVDGLLVVLFQNCSELTVKTVAVVTAEPQTRLLLWTAHLPLLLVKVKPVPDVVAVNVAQVPMYHVPPLMMQPLLVLPPSAT